METILAGYRGRSNWTDRLSAFASLLLSVTLNYITGDGDKVGCPQVAPASVPLVTTVTCRFTALLLANALSPPLVILLSPLCHQCCHRGALSLKSLLVTVWRNKHNNKQSVVIVLVTPPEIFMG